MVIRVLGNHPGDLCLLQNQLQGGFPYRGMSWNRNHVAVIVFQNHVASPLSGDCMPKFAQHLDHVEPIVVSEAQPGISMTTFWSGLVFCSMDSMTS